jgi:hypothetical protein
MWTSVPQIVVVVTRTKVPSRTTSGGMSRHLNAELTRTGLATI